MKYLQLDTNTNLITDETLSRALYWKLRKYMYKKLNCSLNKENRSLFDRVSVTLYSPLHRLLLVETIKNLRESDIRWDSDFI